MPLVSRYHFKVIIGGQVLVLDVNGKYQNTRPGPFLVGSNACGWDETAAAGQPDG